jgi:hypothetical protein
LKNLDSLLLLLWLFMTSNNELFCSEIQSLVFNKNSTIVKLSSHNSEHFQAQFIGSQQRRLQYKPTNQKWGFLDFCLFTFDLNTPSHFWSAFLHYKVVEVERLTPSHFGWLCPQKRFCVVKS